MVKSKNISNYKRLMFSSIFFDVLLIMTVFVIWVFCSEINIYILKQRGGQTVGEIKKVWVTSKNYLCVEYLYRIGEKDYLGTKYYRESKKYVPNEIKNVVTEMQGKKIPVYYDYTHPEEAVCFITHENLRLNKALVIAVVVAWLVWGIGYFQSQIWDRN